jgi:hypothetical protein
MLTIDRAAVGGAIGSAPATAAHYANRLAPIRTIVAPSATATG